MYFQKCILSAVSKGPVWNGFGCEEHPLILLGRLSETHLFRSDLEHEFCPVLTLHRKAQDRAPQTPNFSKSSLPNKKSRTSIEEILSAGEAGGLNSVVKKGRTPRP